MLTLEKVMAGNIITSNLCDRSDWYLDDKVNKVVIENIETFKKAVGAMRRNMPFQFFFFDESIFEYLKACYYYVYKNPNGAAITTFIHNALIRSRGHIASKLKTMHKNECYLTDKLAIKVGKEDRY